ncbi:MAG: hypothetical protein WED00_11415 [Aquisalimonadaceae bacterium]
MKKSGQLLACLALSVLCAAPAVADQLTFSSPAEEMELQDSRGMADHSQLQLSQSSQRAEMTGNQIGTAYTGSNYLSSDAFGSVTGVTSVIQNTGNHVIIQDALVLNLSVTP